jgi:hypothetical protein
MRSFLYATTIRRGQNSLCQNNPDTTNLSKFAMNSLLEKSTKNRSSVREDLSRKSSWVRANSEEGCLEDVSLVSVKILCSIAHMPYD